MTEKELRKEYLEASTKRMIPLSFEDWLVERVCSLEEDLHGHILSVRVSDLEEHFAESDLEFVTQEMLEDIAESAWHSDAAAWEAMFDKHVGTAIADHWQYWYDKIQEEKKQRKA